MRLYLRTRAQNLTPSAQRKRSPCLQADERVARIVGIARRPFDPSQYGWDKMEYRRGDVRDPAALKEAFEGADNFGFLLAGVPNLAASQDPANYLTIYHADSDDYAHVDREGARVNDGIAAALVWGLAERPERLAPRQTPAQVREVLKATKLDEAIEWLGLKAFQPGGKRRPRR